ncbi:MAG: tetratricopeptide repeat protein, partial [Nitrospira sp.]|nr:tetratricopeptide repeat protein [Nitrospira sp.]
MTSYSSKWLRALCVIITLVSVSCTGSSPEAKMAAHLEQAEQYFKNHKYQEAIIEYRNVIQLDDKHANAHYQLALAYLKLGGIPNLQAAFGALNRTVELDKTNHDAQLKLGELLLLGNDPAKARERAEIVLVSAPQHTEGLILKGRSLINEKHFAEAIPELKKAIELDPKNMRAYIELSRAHLFSKDPAAAETVLNQALAVDPRSTEILLALGDLRTTTGKPDQAEALYTQALEIDAQNEQIYLHLAAFYQRAAKWAEVEATFNKLAGLKPHDEKPHILLGDFFTWLGQGEKALTSYQRATEVQPDSTIARDKLIGHYLDTGKPTEAETRVKDILTKNAKDLMGRFFDARLLLAKHKPDDAIPILQGVIKDEPQFAGAHHFLGVAYMQKRQPAQARASFADAVKHNPRMTESRTALAQLHLAEGSADLALEQAQAAIQLNPRNVQAAIVAGTAYLKKGDPAKSRKVFEAIAQALPNEPMGPYQLGLVSRYERNDAKALAFFEEALKRRPSAIEPITQIASIKLAQGKSDEARKRVEQQLEQAPQSALLHNLLGQLSANAKNYVQAEEEYRKAIELDSGMFQAYLNLAGVYLRLGKQDQATKEYEAVLAKDANSIQAHMMLGMIHESKQEFDKAQARYETILKLNPRFVPAANNLAWIMAEQGGNLDVALAHA